MDVELHLVWSLDWKKRGLVTQHHNEVTDVIGDNGLQRSLKKEPVAKGAPSLIADLSIMQKCVAAPDCGVVQCT